MKMNNVLAVIGAAAIGYVIYKGYKEAKKQEEKFKAYKNEKIGDRDIKQEIADASVNNSSFEAGSASKINNILMKDWKKIKKAQNIKEFDDAWDEFNEKLKNLTDPDTSLDQKLAWMIVYNDRLLEKEQKRREENNEKLEQDKLWTELEKAKTIAKAIDRLGQMTKTGNVSLEQILKTAESITIKKA